MPLIKNNKQYCYVAGMRIDATTYEKASEKAFALLSEKKSSFICIANTHVATEAYKSSQYRSVINSADIVTPDGMPLLWCLRLFGAGFSERVCGPDLLFAICCKAEKRGVRVGFYGGRKAIRRLMVQKIKKQYPKLQVVYSYSPPFRDLSDEEEQKIINDIAAVGTQILFVGLGCPKQELWAGNHLGVIPCLMITVGAAFDYIAGTIRRAPKTVQIMGLEWMTRLAQNPRRLWKRYFLRNSLFIYLAVKEFVRIFFLGKNKKPTER